MTYNMLMKEVKNFLKTYQKYACYNHELFELEYVLSPDLPINLNVKLKDDVAKSCKKNAINKTKFIKNFCNKDNLCMKIEIYDENDITYFDLNGKEYKSFSASIDHLNDNDILTNFIDDLMEQVVEYNPINVFINELEKHKDFLKEHKINISYVNANDNIELDKETLSFKTMKKDLYNNLNFHKSFEKEIRIFDQYTNLRIFTEINPFYYVECTDAFHSCYISECFVPCLNREEFEKHTIETIDMFMDKLKEYILFNK